jgi:ABC-type lipoprotein export system ATPase subunit
LTGDLEIKCTTKDDGSIQCAFLQDTITSVFGSSGLLMDGCQFGECVAQTVIDSAANSTSSETTTTAKELSGGVVAGLVVVGILVLAFFLMFVWGWIVQRKAKTSGDGKLLKSGRVAVAWSAVTYSVPDGASGGLFKKKAQGEGVGEKHILNDLSGSVNPGEMLAILGPSGAGKTTLIEILGGKSKLGKVTGSISFAAISASGESSDLIKHPRIGYVDQLDVLPSMLTVEEALMFAADLRLPDWVTAEQKRAKVFDVMKQLGILDIKDTRIGSSERRGISGGEQRRVSIGLELVANPDILVLDEPTSG